MKFIGKQFRLLRVCRNVLLKNQNKELFGLFRLGKLNEGKITKIAIMTLYFPLDQ